MPVLPREKTDMEAEWLKLFFKPDTIVFLIPIVAILVGGIIAVVTILIRHRERMTMIEHGIHPDYRPEEPLEDEDLPR